MTVPEAIPPEQDQPENRMLLTRRQLIGAGAALLFGGGGVLVYNVLDDDKPEGLPKPEFDGSREADILAHGNWSYMPGATPTKDGLQIERVGLTIRKEQSMWRSQDEPEHFAVMPVNAWTHVETEKRDGDAGVRARLSGITGKAAISVMSKPTFRYDERIYRHPGVDVEIENNVATVKLWRGNNEAPDVTKELTLGAHAKNADITVFQTGSQIRVQVNDEKTAFLDTSVFDSGQMWFGLDTSVSYNLSELQAYSAGNNSVRVVDSTEINFGTLDPSGLQAMVNTAGRPDLTIGSAIDLAPLTYDPQYARLVMSQCGGLATEMLAKAQNIQPVQGNFVLDDVIAARDLAYRHGKKFHYHTAVFGEANPAWMERVVDAAASPQEALDIMAELIATPLKAVQPDTVDVVNEPFDAEDWSKLRPHIWMRKIGKQYIAEAFRIAHNAAPKAVLFINDYAFEHDPDKWKALIELVTELQKRQVPIHGIGFQAHLDLDDIEDILGSDVLAQRFKQLEGMGLKVRISEMSVEGEDPDKQAQVYGKVMATCMQARNCVGFNMWGMASNSTYFTSEPDSNYDLGPEQFGNDAPWEQTKSGAYQPKSAVAALHAAIRRAAD